MFTIDGSFNISITRGDTATLEITFTGDAPGAADCVIASLKKSARKEDEYWTKELSLTEFGVRTIDDVPIAYSTYLMEIASEDTEERAFGNYWWDVRILFEDGQITTPFPPATFAVLEVVTDLPEEGDGG